jgi:hypothetical protein
MFKYSIIIAAAAGSILRMADAAEGVDPLDTNVNDIPTGYPLLPGGIMDLRIKSAVKEPTKKNDGERITFTLETFTETKDTKQQVVAPGWQVKHYVGITTRASEGDKRAYTNADIAKNLAEIGKSAGLNASPRDIINNPAQLDGKIVRVNLKVNKATEEFDESNRVGSFLVVK